MILDFQDESIIKVCLFHGDREKDPNAIQADPERGLYFTTDAEYASGYGPHIHKAVVFVKKPRVYSELESQGDMELDSKRLMDDGYDSRVIAYADGQMDVIVFDVSQVQWK